MVSQMTVAEIHQLSGGIYRAARQAAATQGVAFAEDLTNLRRDLESRVRQALEQEPDSAPALAHAIAEAACSASDGLVAPVASTGDEWRESRAGAFVHAARRGLAAVGRGEALAVFSINRLGL